jgi:hypothetical protein
MPLALLAGVGEARGHMRLLAVTVGAPANGRDAADTPLGAKYGSWGLQEMARASFQSCVPHART